MKEGVAAGSREVKPVLVLTALVVAVASFQLNATMLAPAIGTMAAELNTDIATIGMSSTVFSFVTAIAGLFWPPLSDIIGRKRALLLSTGILTLGSLVATLAVNVPMLMVGRAMQGACGATFALSFLVLRRVVEPKRFGRYVGIITAINAGVGGVDTLLGGIVADAVGFRGIFGLTLLLEIVAVIMIALWTPEIRELAAARMDWWGIGTLTLALIAINFGLTTAFLPGGWTDWKTWVSFVIAGVALIAFRVGEGRIANPLLPIEALSDRGVWGLLLTTFFTLASSFSVLVFIIPAVTQDPEGGFGLSSTWSALLFLMPYSLLGWATAPVFGTLAPRIGYRLVLRIGLLSSLVLTGLMIVGVSNAIMLACVVFFMGATYSAAASCALNGLGIIYAPASHPGILPGMNSAAFNFGAAVGIGIMSAVISDTPGSGGYRNALIVATVFTGLAFVFSLVLPARQVEGEKV
jgi:predicted MFS family arabinose efflux permease